MLRPPVSLKRLTYRENGMVHYQGRFHPTLGRDHQLVTGVEFLAMLVPHITLRYECRIHLYGAISTTFRKRWGWIDTGAPTTSEEQKKKEDEQEDESPWQKARRKNWAHFIRKVWMQDPEECPKCSARLKVVAATTSPGQDDVIEAILRSRNEWNPPWQRRAPPQRHPDPHTKMLRGAEPYIDYEVRPDQIWTDDD